MLPNICGSRQTTKMPPRTPWRTRGGANAEGLLARRDHGRCRESAAGSHTARAVPQPSLSLVASRSRSHCLDTRILELAWLSQEPNHCESLAFPTRLRARTAASFAFFRVFSSPSGHMWQWQHPAPWTHPSGFQNHPQGLHLPVPWRSAPAEACGCRIVLGRLGGGLGGSAERPSCTEPFSDDGAVRLSPSDVLPQDKDAEPCRLTPTHQLLQAATARPSIWSSSSKNPSMNVFFTFTS
mmetsp:Transcript_90004/g.238140  ORF Transcript_90004/g.238140 Transcript_90004/m.238140 type:complete len:239 (-) Transcript_90004:347-1063(-)